MILEKILEVYLFYLFHSGFVFFFLSQQKPNFDKESYLESICLNRKKRMEGQTTKACLLSQTLLFPPKKKKKSNASVKLNDESLKCTIKVIAYIDQLNDFGWRNFSPLAVSENNYIPKQ